MNWLKNHAVAIAMALFTAIGLYVAMVTNQATLEQRVTSLESGSNVTTSYIEQIRDNDTRVKLIKADMEDIERQVSQLTGRLVVVNDELNLIKSDTKVTNQILMDFQKSVERFSQSTTNLTQAVIRLDERVKTLEKEK